MIRRIRISYGDSDITYNGENIGDLKNIPQGVIQGSSAGPSIWTVLSSVVIDVLYKRGFGCKVTSFISKQLFALVEFSYVDNSDFVHRLTHFQYLYQYKNKLTVGVIW